jgi:hypothetical protein
MMKPYLAALSLSAVLLLYITVSEGHDRACSCILSQPAADSGAEFYNVIAVKLPRGNNDSTDSAHSLQTDWVKLGEGQHT